MPANTIEKAFIRMTPGLRRLPRIPKMLKIIMTTPSNMLIQRSCESARPISIDVTEAIGFFEEDLEISSYKRQSDLLLFATGLYISNHTNKNNRRTVFKWIITHDCNEL